MTYRVLANGKSLLPWLPVVMLLVGGGIAWGQMTAAAEQVKENKEAIETLKGAVSTIKVMQMETKTKVEGEIKRAAERHEQVKGALDLLIRRAIGNTHEESPL